MARQDTNGILDGKVAFVAGGTSGVNLGIAKRLAAEGACVAVLGRDQGKAERAAAEIRAESGARALALTADVRDYDAIESAYDKVTDEFGNLDIVVSGAAGNFLAPALGMSSNAFKAVVDIDLLGTFNVLRASYKHLRIPGASLISITAGQAVNPRPFQAHVCAAKAGVNMLTKCLAMEWGPAGIRVNAISPGPVKGTEGMRRLTPTAEAEAAFTSRIPLRRYADAAEIGNVAVFLCSPAAAYITGTVVDCDGGVQLGDASADALALPER